MPRNRQRKNEIHLWAAVTTDLIVVDVCVLVAVVDDDIRLLRFECRDLLAAFWADDARIVDHGAAVLAKFCVLLRRTAGRAGDGIL